MELTETLTLRLAKIERIDGSVNTIGYFDNLMLLADFKTYYVLAHITTSIGCVLCWPMQNTQKIKTLFAFSSN